MQKALKVVATMLLLGATLLVIPASVDAANRTRVRIRNNATINNVQICAAVSGNNDQNNNDDTSSTTTGRSRVNCGTVNVVNSTVVVVSQTDTDNQDNTF